LGKVREDLHVEPTGLGQLPGRSDKLTDRPRSDDLNRQSNGNKRPRQRHFETARRFEHDQDGRYRWLHASFASLAREDTAVATRAQSVWETSATRAA
jgi:hypothetical protein